VLHTVLLLLFVLFVLLAAMFKDPIKSALSLASASVILALLFFQLKAPIAAVVELSVGAGLITVLFVSAVSLVSVAPKEGESDG
jgi:NADH-quinone oxidoreductase subunit J